MDATKIQVKVDSKKEMAQGSTICTIIELNVPYDNNSVFYRMSGGTTMMLSTINQAAADMFVTGKDYMITIEPVVEPVKED